MDKTVHYSEDDKKVYYINRYLKLKQKIRELRILALTGITEAGSGHPGASFSAAEIMGSLYFQIMNVDLSNPSLSNRDYFVNSKAHSAPGYYATLCLAGSFPKEEMLTLRKLNSRLQGHPVRYSEHQNTIAFRVSNTLAVQRVLAYLFLSVYVWLIGWISTIIPFTVS